MELPTHREYGESVSKGREDGRPIAGLFVAGVACLSLLWSVQPLLPLFADTFALRPATSALALSVSTAPLALAIMALAAWSESVGRKPLMVGSLMTAAALHAACALAPSWSLLLLFRFLEGWAVGGVPAVAMAYLAEEMAPRRLGAAMGLYVAGTAAGGMLGRVLSPILAESWGWRGAMAGLGVGSFILSVAVALLLPASRRFRPRRVRRRLHLAAWKRHLDDPELRPLFVTAALVMAAFVATYNYLAFHLSGSPYDLAPRWIGLLFSVYALGMLASSAAGALGERLGRTTVRRGGMVVMLAGLALTLHPSLLVVLLGVAALTMGFFATHAMASGGVGRTARGTKGHASALYLFAYYVGASLGGWVGGFVWERWGWRGSVLFAAVLVGGALVSGVRGPRPACR